MKEKDLQYYEDLEKKEEEKIQKRNERKQKREEKRNVSNLQQGFGVGLDSTVVRRFNDFDISCTACRGCQRTPMV